MTPRDLDAVLAYSKTVSPVRREVPQELIDALASRQRARERDKKNNQA